MLESVGRQWETGQAAFRGNLAWWRHSSGFTFGRRCPGRAGQAEGRFPHWFIRIHHFSTRPQMATTRNEQSLSLPSWWILHREAISSLIFRRWVPRSAIVMNHAIDSHGPYTAEWPVAGQTCIALRSYCSSKQWPLDNTVKTDPCLRSSNISHLFLLWG